MLQNGLHEIVGAYTFGSVQGTTAGKILVDTPYIVGIAYDDNTEKRKLLLGVESERGISLLKLAALSSATQSLAYALRRGERDYAGHWAVWDFHDMVALTSAYDPLSEAFFISEREALATLYDMPRKLLEPIRSVSAQAVRSAARGTGSVRFSHRGKLPWK